MDKFTSDDKDEINEGMAQRVMSRANRVYDKDRRGSKVRLLKHLSFVQTILYLNVYYYFLWLEQCWMLFIVSLRKERRSL